MILGQFYYKFQEATDRTTKHPLYRITKNYDHSSEGCMQTAADIISLLIRFPTKCYSLLSAPLCLSFTFNFMVKLISPCNIPDPLTDKEDTSKTSTNSRKTAPNIPMNMNMRIN